MVVRFSNKHSAGKTGSFIPCNSEGGFNQLLYFGFNAQPTTNTIYLKESQEFYISCVYSDFSYTCSVSLCVGYVRSTEKGSKLVFTQDCLL